MVNIMFLQKVALVISILFTILGGVLMVWSLKLQRRETVKQNQRMIEQGDEQIRLLKEIKEKK